MSTPSKFLLGEHQARVDDNNVVAEAEASMFIPNSPNPPSGMAHNDSGSIFPAFSLSTRGGESVCFLGDRQSYHIERLEAWGRADR